MNTSVIRMLPKQLNFLTLDTKWAAAKGGVGSGKTMAAAWNIIRRLENYPDANHVVVGADYDQLRRGFFPSLIGVLEEDLGWEPGRDFTYRENPTPMVRFLHNGARLRSMSAELAQRVRSAEFQTIYCEEPQTWHNGNGADTYRAIVGRLRHSRKSSVVYPDMPLQGRMTFNPSAVGTWLYKLIEEQWKSQGWPCLTFSLRENTLLRGREEYIHQIETTYPQDRWPTEIDGEWSTIGGDWYRGFDLSIHGVNPPKPLPEIARDPQRPLMWSLDFNVGWMASVVCQVYAQQRVSAGVDLTPGKPPVQLYRNEVPSWQRRIIYCLDEIFLRDSGAREAAQEFIRRYGDHARAQGIFLFGDPSGGNKTGALDSTASARSMWEIVLAELQAAGIPYTICIRHNHPSPINMRNAVLTQFRDGDGVGFVLDPQRCPNLVIDFQTVRFKPGENKMEKDLNTEEGRKRTHLGDALSYLIDVDRAVARGETVEFKSFMAR